ncbi:outer membrane protein assembly factor BamD [Paucibacter sp. APW11]|uniref:Outer membrane protein assembly factor BamD n=1 Tax=Roseateles aquae TaxID=3077235 RepID=A0ABU3P7H7_9BURK|nr:outer membrane protein assembly factor BamD [Paucibacter sp. APW11]MDT8998526.1 outer membrane protein assembly factor BamD [Paucibacter sp. APW11]
MIEIWGKRQPTQAAATEAAGRETGPSSRVGLGLVLAAVALALAACSSPFKDDPNSQASLDKLYAEAKDDLASGSYERAIKSLERIEGRAAGTTMGQQAQLDLAWAYHKSGERAQAVSTLDRFIKLNPSSPAMDYALYLKGLANFNEDLGLFGRLANQDVAERDQQASRDALLAFRQLVDQYPDSRYAGDAAVRVDFITNTLANYEVHVARYYYNRGAYVAAANRAQQAVQEFQRAPATEEALYIMSQSYAKLGLDPLSKDAYRVLEKNYPQSSFITGELRNKKAWWKLW